MQIDKSANDGHMNHLTFRKADCFSSKPFYTSSESEMISFNFLRVSFSGDQMSFRNFSFIGKISIGIHGPDMEWLQKFQKLIEIFVFTRSKCIG